MKEPEPFSLLPFLFLVEEQERNCNVCSNYHEDPEDINSTYCSLLREVITNEDDKKRLSGICSWEYRKLKARELKNKTEEEIEMSKRIVDVY